MKSYNFEIVRVVGLARDVQSTVETETIRLEQILGQIFSRVEFFIVESDSSDLTVSKLMYLAKSIPNFSFISLQSLKATIPNRIERLIYCRNKYVEWIRNQSDSSPIIVVDFDLRNSKLRSSQIREALTLLPFADGIFANQSGRYFDIYALRCSGWSDFDCYAEYSVLRQEMGADAAKEIAIWSKMRKIDPKEEPIEVDSAFGGLGIYNCSVFRSFDYSPVNSSGVLESEHLALHKKIRLSGKKLYIDPGLLNFGWNPHNLSSFKMIRSLDQLTKGKVFVGFRRFIRDKIR